MSTKLAVVFSQQISAVCLIYDQAHISHAFADAVYEALLICTLTQELLVVLAIGIDHALMLFQGDF